MCFFIIILRTKFHGFPEFFYLFICQFEAETMLKNKAIVLRILSLDQGITLFALLSVISARVSDEFLSSCLVRKCQNQQVDKNENS